MTDQIQKVMEELGEEILFLAQSVLKEHGIDEKSKLYKNLKIEIDSSQPNTVTDSLYENYITYIENGRAPKTGKRPPIDALRDWAQNKGLPTDNGTLYAISTAIWRDGIEPRPILATLQERIEEYMDNEFNDKLMQAISEELNTYFE